MSDQENAGISRPEDVGYWEKKFCGGSGGWWEDRSLPWKILIGIGFGILGVGAGALIGWVTMLLWNWLMPEIFGLTRINYWQSWGLLILSFILFKNWSSGDSSGRSDRKRKRHLGRYMREDQSPSGEEPTGEAPAESPQE